MKVLELFSGTASFSKVAKERGHKTFTIDFDKSFNPDLCIDILDFDISMLPEEFRNPDVIWASPPCTTFSCLSIRYHWKDKKPISDRCKKSIEIVNKTIKIIDDLKPKFYFIENPMGMLRKQEFMLSLNRKTITYCKYGLPYMKKTDIWTNSNQWIPRTPCKNNDPCHLRSPRGSRNGIQGTIGFRENRNKKHPIDISRTKWSDAVLRAIVPRELCLEIIKSCELNSATNLQ